MNKLDPDEADDRRGLYWAAPAGAYVREMFDDEVTVVEWSDGGFFALGDERQWKPSDFRVVSARLEPPTDLPDTEPVATATRHE